MFTWTRMTPGVAVVLAGSRGMARGALGIDINAAAVPVRGRLAAVTAYPAAGGAAGIVAEGAGSGLVSREHRDSRRRSGIIMHRGVGAGPIMAGHALSGDLRKTIV